MKFSRRSRFDVVAAVVSKPPLSDNRRRRTRSKKKNSEGARKKKSSSLLSLSVSLSVSLSWGKKFLSFLFVWASGLSPFPPLCCGKIETLNPRKLVKIFLHFCVAKRRRFNFFFLSLSFDRKNKEKKSRIYISNLAKLSFSFLLSLFARQRETERERQKGCFFQRQRGKDGSERLISHLLLLIFRLADTSFFRMSLRRRPRNLLHPLLLLRAFEDFKAAAARVVVVVVEEEDGIARR